MKELTQQELIKIYSAYLPYNLQIEFKRNIYPRSIEIQTLDLRNFDLWLNPAKRNSFLIKPILWDLSMLTKEITHEGKTFIPIVEILRKTSLLDLSQCNFDVYQDEEKFTQIIYVNAEDNNGRIIDSMYYDSNLFWHMNNGAGYNPTNPQNEPQEMLLSFHFNIFGLDESQYINKATCK